MKILPRLEQLTLALGMALVISAGDRSSANVPDSPYAWYKADVGLNVTEHDNITSWSNQVTGAHDLDRVIGSPKRVLLGRIGGGSAQVVSFGGSSALWAAASEWGGLSSDRCVIIRCRLTGSEDGFLFDGSTKSGKTRAQIYDGDWQSGVQSHAAAFDSRDPVTSVSTPNVWQTHIFNFTESDGSTEVTHYTDGNLGGSHSLENTDTNLGGLIIAAHGGASGWLACEVAEIIIYNRSLSESERSNATTYLDEKWGNVIDLPLAYQSATTIQNTGNAPIFGLHGIVALKITSSGNIPAYALTGLKFNLNGTTDIGDIDELRLYVSTDAQAFSPSRATLAGVMPPSTDATLNFDVTASVDAPETCFWLVAKMSGNSDLGDSLDAEIVQFTIDGNDAGPQVPDVTAPPGELTLDSLFFSTIVRAGGDDQISGFRIPGLVTSNAGTLVAVFDIRHNNYGDLPGNIDVGVMRSTDGGFSWGPMITIMDFDHNVPGSSGNGVGDPCILVNKHTGRIWCAALWSKGNNGWHGSGPGLDPDDTGQLVINYSDDDGVTWSDPVSITSQIKNPSWNLFFQGPGKGIFLRDGTIIFPSQYRDASGTPRSNFIYSRDDGASWHVSPPAIPSGSPWTTESQIIDLDSGHLLLTMRNHAGNGKRLWCVYSWDHATQTIADGSWGNPWYEQTDPVVMASLERYRSTLDGHPFSALIFANPDNSSRSKMTVRLSLDEGSSWPYKRKLDDRPAAYSCMTILPDGHIGILYETGSSSSVAQLEFARFPLDWLVGDTDTDSDGIPDFYEDVMGLLKDNAADAAVDHDQDGMTNLEEYWAQTDPHASNSTLSANLKTLHTGNLELSWASIPYTRYRVESSPTMSRESWRAVSGMSNITAQETTTRVLLPNTQERRTFYRVAVPSTR